VLGGIAGLCTLIGVVLLVNHGAMWQSPGRCA
jgi:hypothetical protein